MKRLKKNRDSSCCHYSVALETCDYVCIHRRVNTQSHVLKSAIQHYLSVPYYGFSSYLVTFTNVAIVLNPPVDRIIKM